MVELSNVLKQLSKAGYRSRLWQRSEVKELCKVLHEDEVILSATNGYYEGGFSLMVATDSRLLLVDRKPMFLTLDSIAYTMIQEMSFNYRLLNSTIHIYTSNKCLDFSSWNHTQIRNVLNIAQQAMRKVKQDQEEVANAMHYEHLAVPSYTGQPPLPQPMQQPAYFINENAQPSYAPEPASSIVNNSAVSPSAVTTEPSFDPYRQPVFAQRRYSRRYY